MAPIRAGAPCVFRPCLMAARRRARCPLTQRASNTGRPAVRIRVTGAKGTDGACIGATGGGDGGAVGPDGAAGSGGGGGGAAEASESSRGNPVPGLDNVGSCRLRPQDGANH